MSTPRRQSTSRPARFGCRGNPARCAPQSAFLSPILGAATRSRRISLSDGGASARGGGVPPSRGVPGAASLARTRTPNGYPPPHPGGFSFSKPFFLAAEIFSRRVSEVAGSDARSRWHPPIPPYAQYPEPGFPSDSRWRGSRGRFGFLDGLPTPVGSSVRHCVFAPRRRTRSLSVPVFV
jgi:hypothetical protein